MDIFFHLSYGIWTWFTKLIAILNTTMMKIKKQKAKKVYYEKTLKFQDYENGLEAAQIENKINH